ncbi:Peptidase C1A [Aphelenchoides avenae]|nr:Peptidase C1A [Aphelenchus avenae]
MYWRCFFCVLLPVHSVMSSNATVAANSTKQRFNATDPITACGPPEQAATYCDWSELGVTGDVYNQGRLPTCGMYASFTVLQAQTSRLEGRFVPLSLQGHLDCNPPYEIWTGCEIPAIFGQIKKSGGYLEDNQYQRAYTGCICPCEWRREEVPPHYTVEDILKFENTGAKRARELIFTNGPLVAQLCATAHFDSYNFREEPILIPRGWDQTCTGTTASDYHGVALIGYRTDEEGNTILKIQNSAGPKWGNNGKAEILVNCPNPFGIFRFLTVPKVKRL